MIDALTVKKNKAVTEAKAILDLATNENRSLTPEESTRADAFFDEAEAMTKQIERNARLLSLEQDQERSQGRMTRNETRSALVDPHEALRAWLLMGTADLTDSQRSAVHSAGLSGNRMTFQLRKDPLRSMDQYNEWQNRAQGEGTGSTGGYTVAPDFLAQLERAQLLNTSMRSVATVMRTATGVDLPMPTANDTGVGATIIAENAEFPASNDMAFGQVVMHAWTYATDIVKISTELLQDSAIDLGIEIGGALGERLARGTAAHYATGSGSGQPQGAVTGATLGITAAATAAITNDELIDLEHSVDAVYRPGAVYVFHDTTLRELKKLKDSTGRALWNSGIADNAPPSLNGYRYIVDNNMPVLGAGNKAVLFGALSKYRVRDVQDIVIVKLVERYAEFGQVAFVAQMRTDGRMIDAGTHPVRFLICAAS